MTIGSPRRNQANVHVAIAINDNKNSSDRIHSNGHKTPLILCRFILNGDGLWVEQHRLCV
jgi:hypothetical protein